MRSFIIKGLIVLVIVIVADFLFGVFYSSYIKNLPNSGLSQTDSYFAINKEAADVIVLGASNAKRGYNPEIFEQYGILDMYNAALDGNEMIYHLAVLKSMIARRCPRIVILDINKSCLDGSWLERLKIHKHMYRDNENIRDMLNNSDVDSYMSMKANLSLYIYNSTIPWVIRAYMMGAQKKDLRGFDPLYGVKNTDMVLLDNKWNGAVNRKELNAFHEILDICRSNNIKLFICIAPTFQINDPNFSNYIRKEVRKESVVFVDFSNNDYYLNHKELFYDANHLNIEGANEYSKQIAEIMIK